jgi:hypothetical protein
VGEPGSLKRNSSLKLKIGLPWEAIKIPPFGWGVVPWIKHCFKKRFDQVMFYRVGTQAIMVYYKPA